jgi:hypothetical protein
MSREMSQVLATTPPLASFTGQKAHPVTAEYCRPATLPGLLLGQSRRVTELQLDVESRKLLRARVERCRWQPSFTLPISAGEEPQDVRLGAAGRG